MPNLEIHITTEVELAGARALEAQLERNIGKAKALGKDTAPLEAQLSRVRAAIQESGMASNEAAGKMDKHAISGEKLHRVINALNRVTPGLGALFQSAFSPIGAAITIAVMALDFFRTKIREVNEELDRAGEEAAKPFSHRMEAVREGIITSAVAAAQFAMRLDEASRSEQSLSDALKDTVANLAKQTAAAEAAADAQQSKELSQLEVLHAAGIVATEQYEAAKFAIEERYAQRKRELEERRMTEEIQMKKRALSLAEANQDELEKEADQKQKKAREAEVNAVTKERNAKQNEADREENAKQIAEMKKKLGDEADTFDGVLAAVKTGKSASDALWDTGRYHTPSGQGGALERFKKWQDLQIKKEDLDKEWNNSPQDVGEAKADAERAKREADEADRRAIDNRKFVTDQQTEIDRQSVERDAKVEDNKLQGQTEREIHQNQLNARRIKRQSELENNPDLTPEQSQELWQLQSRPPVPMTVPQSLIPSAQAPAQGFNQVSQAMSKYNDAVMGGLEGLHSHTAALTDKVLQLESRLNADRPFVS